jgi:hypothetical protein
MEKAEQQQRRDSEELLRHGKDEFEAYVLHYQRLKANVDLFVERSNYELAALAQLIEQKRQNLITLEQMRHGHAVAPGDPVAKIGGNFTPPPEVKPTSPNGPNGKAPT